MKCPQADLFDFTLMIANRDPVAETKRTLEQNHQSPDQVAQQRLRSEGQSQRGDRDEQDQGEQRLGEDLDDDQNDREP